MPVKVLALDLERTLVDDAMNGTPRPGLYDFLAFCHEHLDRVVLFTSVETTDARKVLNDLDAAGCLPPGFLERLEYVEWCGEHKDIGFVPGVLPDEFLLVDDDAGWIRPDQREQWVPIAAWDGGADDELARVRLVLAARM